MKYRTIGIVMASLALALVASSSLAEEHYIDAISKHTTNRLVFVYELYFPTLNCPISDSAAAGLVGSVVRGFHLEPRQRTNSDKLFFRYTVDCEHFPMRGTAYNIRGIFVVDLQVPLLTSIAHEYSIVGISDRRRMLRDIKTVSNQAVGDYIAANRPVSSDP